MKISARNVFDGHITSIKEGPISAEVTLTLPGGQAIVAGITEGSVQQLGLAPGKAARAIVKAPLVLLATETEGWHFTARNQLRGVVSAIEPGAVNASVEVALPGGARLVSTITRAALSELGLGVDTPVVALFKAGSVVLAVPA